MMTSSELLHSMYVNIHDIALLQHAQDMEASSGDWRNVLRRLSLDILSKQNVIVASSPGVHESDQQPGNRKQAWSERAEARHNAPSQYRKPQFTQATLIDDVWGDQSQNRPAIKSTFITFSPNDDHAWPSNYAHKLRRTKRSADRDRGGGARKYSAQSAVSAGCQPHMAWHKRHVSWDGGKFL